MNPRIEIVARVETPEEAKRLLDRGASQTVEGERELAVQMARYTLRRFGVTSREVEAIARSLPEQYRQVPLPQIYGMLLDRAIDFRLLANAAEDQDLADSALCLLLELTLDRLGALPVQRHAPLAQHLGRLAQHPVQDPAVPLLKLPANLALLGGMPTTRTKSATMSVNLGAGTTTGTISPDIFSSAFFTAFFIRSRSSGENFNATSMKRG